MKPILEVFTVPPFDENCYLVGDAEAGEAIVIDPGGRADDIVRMAERRGVRVSTIVNTHAHIDHVTGVEELKGKTGAPFLLHPAAVPMLQALPDQARMFGLPPVLPPEVEGELKAGRVIEVGDLRLEVRDTPGHAPGHVTLVARDVALTDASTTTAFCGDVIFYRGIGRTDLPGGDYETLMASIEREILTLPDDTVLLSGHGPATTVGQERQWNPFVTEWLARRGGGWPGTAP